MQKILITGGTGYIGAHLSAYLSKKGHRVTVLGGKNEAYKQYPAWCSLMEDILIGDIREKDVLTNIYQKDFDIIINLVSLGLPQSDIEPQKVFAINTLPTWQLLENFSKKNLKRFIYFSTQHVLSHEEAQNIINEASQPTPKSKYALTHLLSENIVNFYHDTTAVTAINARVSSSYGAPIFAENYCWHHVINGLCKMAYERHEIRLLSDGSPLRDFIHVSDICRITEKLVLAESIDRLYHLSSGNTQSILEIAHLIKKVYEEIYNKKLLIFLADGSISKKTIHHKKNLHYVIDTKRINNLGVQSENKQEKFIAEMFSYLDDKNKQE